FTRASGQAQRFHRLGFGKPLGFGSVSTVVDWAHTTLADGSAWRDYYLDLDLDFGPAPAPDEPGETGHPARMFVLGRNAVVRYQQATVRRGSGGSFGQAAHIRAILAAAQGDPDIPVHYPRTKPRLWNGGLPIPPDPRGRSYTWFVTNESPTWTAQTLDEPGGEPLTVSHEKRQPGGPSASPHGQRKR
ncbi:hypothetical protein FrEUN1fDRAFT_7916, partial [Parafrankia sp. EUN1f]